MSYHSGINQRVLDQEFFNNTTAVDQSVNEPNGSLLANLTYVRNYFTSAITNFLPVNNPNFTGSLNSSSGGNITLANPFSYITTPVLLAPTINGVSTFFSQPKISYSGAGTYPIETRLVGEIKILMSSTVPINYLACNGASLLTTSYPALFSVLGYNYGGSGINFNLPQFQDNFPVGGNSTLNGLAVSNLNSGNNSVGGNNNYSFQSYFGGSTVPITPLLTKVPTHSHNITDNGHQHTIQISESVGSTITPVGVQQYMYPTPEYVTLSNVGYTGILINNTGSNIQSIDAVSNLNGVNLTPPFIAVNYYICYQ